MSFIDILAGETISLRQPSTTTYNIQQNEDKYINCHYIHTHSEIFYYTKIVKLKNLKGSPQVAKQVKYYILIDLYSVQLN